MNAIAAVSANWGIGLGNDLLFHISEDMKRFRALTSGGTVIMGRKTLESMPGGKPLPKRRNIVITRNPAFVREGVEAAHSVEEALSLTAGDDPDHVWVIGGGEIYAALVPYCRMCCLTHVDAAPACDVFFPRLSDMANWRLLRAEPPASDGGLSYRFVDYVNTAL